MERAKDRITVFAKLIVKHTDYLGYTTFVFKNLDTTQESPYIMCTMFPNWDQGPINIGDEGFLQIKEIVAGEDTWYDGYGQVPYRYDMVQFIRFVLLPKKEDTEYRL